MNRATHIAIHAVLVLLIGGPLHYYTCNGDKRDERFAWRMFSPIRSERCGTQFLLGPARKPLKASQHFHSAWVGLANRGRRQVIEAMGERLCKTFPGQELHIRVVCETEPGSTRGRKNALYQAELPEGLAVEVTASGAFDFCQTGAL